MRRNLILAILAAVLAFPTIGWGAPPTRNGTLNKSSATKAMAAYIRDGHKPFDESAKVHPVGRRDLVFQSREKFNHVLSFYQDAYANQVKLPGGVTCRGYYVMPAKRKATVTLYLGHTKFMVILKEVQDGTRITLYGVAFQRRQRSKMRPYHRGIARPPVLRYGI